jgi:hypothetical protein
MSESTIEQPADDRFEFRAVEDNLKSRDTWIRLVFMLIYLAVLGVTSMVAMAIIVLGFLVVLVTGERNEQIRSAGNAVANYVRDILRYLTFNEDRKPFPFGADFPAGSALNSSP